MLVNFCLRYIFMNGTRFYLKTTSKIVLPLFNILDEEFEWTLSSITRKETFRKFYHKMSYPNL